MVRFRVAMDGRIGRAADPVKNIIGTKSDFAAEPAFAGIVSGASRITPYLKRLLDSGNAPADRISYDIVTIMLSPILVKSPITVRGEDERRRIQHRLRRLRARITQTDSG
jgi:hypothetical protein